MAENSFGVITEIDMNATMEQTVSSADVTFDAVEKVLRAQWFGTLSTASEQAAPHATGVVYAVSPASEPPALYIVTRTTTRKVRNIRRRPPVAFVFPVPRRGLSVFPPGVIQFQGAAVLLAADDRDSRHAFTSS